MAACNGEVDACGAGSESDPPGLPFLAGEHTITPEPKVLSGLRRFVTNHRYRAWCHDQFRALDIRQTGPILPIAGRSTEAVGLTTHAQVRVYYSSEMVQWLENDRQGQIPDGAMMVKEMYGIPMQFRRGEPVIEGWAVMVRDSAASRDGWLWYLYYPWLNQPYKVQFESAQNGMSFCLACHASADSQSTFAFAGNLRNEDVATYVSLGDASADGPSSPSTGAHGGFAALPDNPFQTAAEITDYKWLLYWAQEQPRLFPNKAFSELFGEVVDMGRILVQRPQRLPMDAAFDHVPMPGNGVARTFVTADNCAGCHDASDLLNKTYPEMTVPMDERHFPGRRTRFANLSPYAEWSGSLMSVSTRDPVFRAQLESELLKYPDQADETAGFCFSCHGAMGQRSHPELPDKLAMTYAVPDSYSARHETFTNEQAEFGALARDGVSCAVCHHISALGLGRPQTFNARFNIGPATELYGPYDDVKTQPMLNGLGIEPVQAAHMSDAGLCGSCHMVQTPVLDHPDPDRRAHEQTTYLEWRNSEFARSGNAEHTCQGCHMSNVNPMAGDGVLTNAKIANIEDSTFPYVPHRLNSDALDVPRREGYRRHTLTGINLFTLRYFAQFPFNLGANTFYPVRPSGDLLSPQLLVMSEATNLARTRTANLTLRRQGPNRVVVSVENLTGHKFPTGVGFRRAWLELSVRDDQERGAVVFRLHRRDRHHSGWPRRHAVAQRTPSHQQCL